VTPCVLHQWLEVHEKMSQLNPWGAWGSWDPHLVPLGPAKRCESLPVRARKPEGGRAQCAPHVQLRKCSGLPEGHPYCQFRFTGVRQRRLPGCSFLGGKGMTDVFGCLSIAGKS
jgi:hypothetical protein